MSLPRRTARLLVAALLVGLLALAVACGGPADTPAEPTATPEVEAPEPTEAPADDTDADADVDTDVDTDDDAATTDGDGDAATSDGDSTVTTGQYNEAPMLAEMVDSGDLPPVDERLPDEPLVMEPVEQIGQYGGTLRRGFLGPSDANNYVRVVFDALVRFSPDGGEVVPHIVESWESSDDFTEWTLHLREGARWSDGEPFTADAIMFWYEDVLLNEDLTPSVPGWMANDDGSAATVERVDDYTVRYIFDEPNTAFLLELANKDGADRTLAAFLPGHYLQQFHPNYADQDELDAMVSDAGYDTWTELFMTRATPPENPERPSMAAWVAETTVSDQVFRITRNPYYFAVDPEGNQLPYIDEVRFTFFADQEALNLAAVGGEFDLQARHINMTNYPVFIENEDQGGYRVITWPTFGGSDAAITFNQTYDDNPEIGELLRTQDFRIALSHAIDRDEIRESAFLGLGEPRQPVPAPWHPYYPGDEYATLYTEYDPDLANQLLDDIGLSERGSDGYRLLPNGDSFTIEISVVPVFGPWTDVGQLVAQYWEDVGIRTNVEVRERTLHFQMRDTNDLMTEIWNEDTTGFPFSGNPKMDPRSHPSTTLAPLVREWYETDGEAGMEPSDEMKQIVDLIDEAKTVGPEEQVEIAHELFQLWAENIFEMGTIGLTPMVQGVVVANQNLRNIPETAGNDWPLRTPGNARPEQFYFEQ